MDKKVFLYACGTLFIYPQYDLMSNSMGMSDYNKVKKLQYSYLIVSLILIAAIISSFFINEWLSYFIIPFFMLVVLTPSITAMLYRFTGLFD